MATRVFINYRRGDDPGFVQALFARLEQSFRSEDLFMDVDHIAAGVDFVRALDEKVAQCDVMLAVIGKGWLDARDADGKRRLDDEQDFVRIEIESAIRRGKLIVPVLVGGATLPEAEDLPASLKPLVRFNAVRLTHERFRDDARGLVSGVQKALKEAADGRLAEEKRRRAQAQQSQELAGARLSGGQRWRILAGLLACAAAGAASGTLLGNNQVFAGITWSLTIGTIYLHDLGTVPFYVPVLFVAALAWIFRRDALPPGVGTAWLLAGTWIGWIVAVNLCIHLTQVDKSPVGIRLSPQHIGEVSDPNLKQFVDRVTSFEKFVGEAIIFTIAGAVGAAITVLGLLLARQGRVSLAACLTAIVAGAVSVAIAFVFSLGFAVMCGLWQGLVGAALAWGLVRSPETA